MRQRICDECGTQIEKPWKADGLTIEPFSFENAVSEEVTGDYCGECAAIVTEAVREAFSDE